MDKTPLARLVAVLAARSITVTPEQAEAMAVRLAGGVDAYLDQLAANDKAAAEYIPAAPGEVSEKFTAPLAYTLESPAESGLPE